MGGGGGGCPLELVFMVHVSITSIEGQWTQKYTCINFLIAKYFKQPYDNILTSFRQSKECWKSLIEKRKRWYKI